MRAIVLAAAVTLSLTAPGVMASDLWYHLETRLRQMAEIEGSIAGIFDACGAGGNPVTRSTEFVISSILIDEETKKMMRLHDKARIEARVRWSGRCDEYSKEDIKKKFASTKKLFEEASEIAEALREARNVLRNRNSAE